MRRDYDARREVETIVADWRARRDDGEQVTPEEIISSHPDLAEELRARFDALALMALVLQGGARTGIPRRVGDFEIVREIGRGGMGVVFEAWQVSMDRRVALKLLSPALTGTEQSVRRFQQEARAAGRLHHVNIVPVYGLGTHNGFWHYTMEFVDGPPLSRVIDEVRRRGARGPFPALAPGREDFARIARIFAGVAEALALAHEHGICHRDIKPSNLLLDPSGILRIVDFGLVRVEAGAAATTQTGQILGTLVYMSPEQALGKRDQVDGRSDVYSLGATLYEALTREPPFSGESSHEICSRILTRDPPRPRSANRRIPRDLETIVMKAMEKDRGRRYATATEFAQDLLRFSEGLPIRARRTPLAVRAIKAIRRRRAVAALCLSVALLVAAAVVFALWSTAATAQRRALRYEKLVARADALRGDPVERLLDSSGRLPEPISTEALEAYDEAIRLLPDRPEAYMSRGLALGRPMALRLSDLERARGYGTSASAYHLHRAFVFASSGEWRRALEEQALAARYPDATLADVFLNAQFHALAGRPRPALERLGVVIDAADAPQPLRLAALRLRARIRLWEHAFGDALEDLRTLRVMTGVDAESAMGRVLSFDLETHTHALWRHIRFAGKSAYEDAKRWADRTEVLLHVKGGRDALARERARLVGDSCRTLAEAARLVEAGLFAEAAAALADAQTDDPADARAPLMLGFVYLHGWSDFTRALPAFHAALRLDERLAPAWLGRAMALAKSRDRRGALAAADRAIAADPTLAAGYAWRALILRLAFRRYADALAAIDKAIDLDATDPVLRLERAVILIGRRQHADALASVEQSLALDGDIRLAHDLRAGLLCGLGLRGDWYRTGNSMERYEEALEAFRQSLECNPLHPATWLRLAQVQRVCGFLGESIDSADRALDLDPTGIDARWQKIRAMTGAQRFEEALREVACLQRTRPGSSHSWRAICLARLGKMEEAAVALLREQSLTYMPRHAQCLELLGRHAEALELAQTETRDRGWCVHRVRLLRAAGRHAEARELAARRLGGYTRRESRVAAAYLHAVAGHAERARELLAGYDLPWTPDLLYEAARAEAVLGDREATLRRLERAADAGLRLPLNAAPDAEFAALVEDPRYRELLTRFARN